MNESLERFLSFTEGSGSVSLETVLLCVLAAFVLGQVVAWLYIWTHRGLSYSASMAQALVALALIVSLVMLVVGNSLARAFGLFGALALIRFRTPIKDSRDTVFLFFSVAVGIATGTQNIVAAAVGTGVIFLVLGYLYLVRFGTRFVHDAMIRFRCPAGGEEEDRVRDTLGRFCDEYTLMHVREAGTQPIMEFAYQLRLVDRRFGSRLVSEIGEIDGVSDLSLLMQDEETQP